MDSRSLLKFFLFLAAMSGEKIHIDVTICKHTGSIRNLIMACLHTYVVRKIMLKHKIQITFLPEKYLLKISKWHFSSFFQLKHSGALDVYTISPSCLLDKSLIFLFMWVSNREEENIKNRKM